MVVLFQGSGMLSQMLQNMEYMGFFLYLFPFLLALAIVYGVLSWTMGDRLPKSARGLISIIIGFFVMLYASWNPWIVNFFAEYFGAGLILATAILVIAILLGLAGYKIERLFEDPKLRWIVILGIIIIAIVVFYGAGAGWLIPTPTWISSAQIWTVVIFILILVIAMWWLGSDAGGSGGAAPKADKKE